MSPITMTTLIRRPSLLVSVSVRRWVCSSRSVALMQVLHWIAWASRGSYSSVKLASPSSYRCVYVTFLPRDTNVWVISKSLLSTPIRQTLRRASSGTSTRSSQAGIALTLTIRYLCVSSLIRRTEKKSATKQCVATTPRYSVQSFGVCSPLQTPTSTAIAVVSSVCNTSFYNEYLYK